MIQIKEEKIFELMFDIWHKSDILENPVVVGKYIAEELSKVKNLAIQGVVSSSNMRKALETVVRGYEGDGMENMQIRDEVFYKTCKEALTFDDSAKG